MDAKRLLDQFLGSSGQSMPGNRGGFPQQQQGHQEGSVQGGGNQGGGIGDMVGGLGNGLGNMLGGNLGGMGGGAVAGGLAALLMGSKSGRKMAGSALQLGGMAVVGALAYKAYQNWQSGKTVTQSTVPTALPPPPADTPFLPARESDQQSLSHHLLRAMIAAAKSDGHVDAKEQATIFAEMDKLPLDADDKAFVIDELRRPLDIDAVAGAARTPEEAASIYTASLLAIDVDNPSERGYLGLLAARLNLDDALVKHLHATVEGATVPAASPTMAG